MRLSAILCLVIILQACTQKTETTTLDADSTATETPQQQPDLNQSQQDSAIFISNVSTFNETREFYTSMYILPELESIPDDLSSKTDSTIYENTEYGESRRRLPLSLAKQYLNFSGIDRISVYNNKGHLVTDAVFVRAEYWEGPIEGEFIAVFKPMIPSWFSEDVAYCVTAGENNFKSINPAVKEIENANLTAKLYKQFEIDSAKVWVNKHITFPHYNSTYSIISTDQVSYIVETKAGQSEVLHKSESDESVMGILPVHFEVNNKPVLLITEGVNDTDMIWTYLAVYSSQGYQPMHGSRIKR